MRLVFVGGLATLGIGLGTFLVLSKKPEPKTAPESDHLAEVSPPPACPPPPIVLADVIELADLDPLLDPPARTIVQTPFEEPSVLPASAIAAPERIPLAID